MSSDVKLADIAPRLARARDQEVARLRERREARLRFMRSMALMSKQMEQVGVTYTRAMERVAKACEGLGDELRRPPRR